MKNPNIHFLTKVAVLYYREGLTHEEIATRLGVSRQSVGRYIDLARNEGLVQILIQSPMLFATELETSLEKKFHLREAIVVSATLETEDAIKEALGIAGADYLQRNIKNGDTIGLAWGSTVLAVGHHLPRVKCENVSVVQLNGSMDIGSYSTRAVYMVDLVASAFSARMVTLSAPMLVDRSEIRDSLLSDSRISAALNVARDANIALFGVGTVSENSSPFKAGYYDPPLIEKLRANGAVGEICGRFYNKEGQPCCPDVDRRTLAVDLDTLKRIPLTIAIAGTKYKKEAILGMLRGGYCRVLITDESTANSLLSTPATTQEVNEIKS